MKRLSLAALFLSAILAAPASAAVLTEGFDEPYVGWESRWFAQNSNAARVFFDANDRGNNVTGWSVFDGNLDDGRAARIFFDPAFGARIRTFAFDILSYNVQTLDVFDSNGVSLLNVTLPAVAGPPFDFADSAYVRYSVSSTSGVGGFSLLPFGAEGNVSIDDLSVTTVPEPASWAMMILGFGLCGTMLRRRAMAIS